MSIYSNGGVFNLAYHDSETLEIDKRSSSKTHSNPYARETPAWWGQRAGGSDAAARGAPQDGWQRESWRGGGSIPMGHIPTDAGRPPWQHSINHSTFLVDHDSQFVQSPSVRLPSALAGNMSMRWRGMTMRRMSLFPHAHPAHAAFTEEVVQSEMENEEKNLVKELVAMSMQDQTRAIRALPMSFEEKKHIRNQVLALKSSNRSKKFTLLAEFSENASLSLRRCGYGVKSAKQTLELWQGIMKEIGGKFGSSVLTYFLFLKWLLMINIFSFLVNFGFITIPLLVHEPSPKVPSNVKFRGLEFLTGAGYFNYTVMYYGGYSNETVGVSVEYDMQLAYFFTIAVYMVMCGLVLIFSMASSFKKNYVLGDPSSNGAWQLLCSWDFSITNERAVRQRRSNLRVQLKESLSEKAQRELLTLSEKLKDFGVHLGCWVLSTSLAVGCGAGIFFLCRHEQQRVSDSGSWSPAQEAETLLVPFVVSLMNLVIPLLYSLFNKFEHYSSQRKQIYALVVRNVGLRMSILGVLCYYWMNVVSQSFSCWESMVGQALYRLVIFDFIFLMLGSFFGEFLSKVVGTKLQPNLGLPEFDVARNVLELIYGQTLAWIGIYFAPLLPAIQILKFLILFYIKKVSLTQNCQPPRRTGRAAQMQTIFIFLLFFPFFVGALSIVAYTAWSLTPSEQCGPFRGLNNTFSAVGVWINHLEEIPGSDWVVWIYQNVIRSEIFYFLITIIIFVIMYIFWQITQGRKKLISLLRQQIVNEGKDKTFLLEKLQNLQKSQPKNAKQRKQKGHRSLGSQSNSSAVVQALLARQQLEEEDERQSTSVSSPSDVSTSSALIQAMMARQRAEHLPHTAKEPPSNHDALARAMEARQRAENEERNEYYSTDFSEIPTNRPSAVAQAMEARQRSEREGGHQQGPSSTQNPAPSGPSALIQAMLARQQAQNEYDDGY
ncbi:transmembrane channel-like protein 5 isoform 1-T3 [Menidia menidia]